VFCNCTRFAQPQVSTLLLTHLIAYTLVLTSRLLFLLISYNAYIRYSTFAELADGLLKQSVSAIKAGAVALLNSAVQDMLTPQVRTALT
jgi:hypothetical protein